MKLLKTHVGYFTFTHSAVSLFFSFFMQIARSAFHFNLLLWPPLCTPPAGSPAVWLHGVTDTQSHTGEDHTGGGSSCVCATSCRQSSYYCKYGKWNELRLCAPMFALHWCPTRSTRRHGGATLRPLANQVSAAATTHKAVWGQKHQLCVSGTKFGRPRTIPSVHCSPPSLSVTGAWKPYLGKKGQRPVCTAWLT